MKIKKVTEAEALQYHQEGVKGKIEITSSKKLSTPDHLSLAYSPGVGYPCLAIQKNPEDAYLYTSKGHLVAVISNGTAVLGLGNLGALASKPVMEGKSILFKNFGGVDSIDIEVDETDVDKFVECVKRIAISFGGINLEDIKAPECFLIEERLKKEVNIPVFHDDQHGTAICSLAALINALEITKKKPSEAIMVVNGAGAAAIACTNLIVKYGLKRENVYMCDTKGVLHSERTDLNEWKMAYVQKTNKRTLADAVNGADIFLGLSQKDVLTPAMLLTMKKDPIVFAMANPDPEISPEVAHETRKDVIMATGRSDYPNQVNNLLAFPYLFRGSLDVRATQINEEMKMATAHAIAGLAKQIIPERVSDLYGTKVYGRDYLIPTPFDPRLIATIPVAVAKAAIESGVAKIKDFDLKAYEELLSKQMDPTTVAFRTMHKAIRENKKRVLFVDGEHDDVIKAASIFQSSEYGQPILMGRKDKIVKKLEDMESPVESFEFIDTANYEKYQEISDYLFEKIWRLGYSKQQCTSLLKGSANMLGATLLELGEVDSMLTGRSISFSDSFKQVGMIIPTKENSIPMEIRVIHVNKKIIFITDTHVYEYPTAQELAKIAVQAARKVREYGFEPRVALLSHSNFGHLGLAESHKVEEAVSILDTMNLDFEYEGEMNVSYALNNKKLKEDYPHSRLTGDANVLVMPGLRTASIGIELIQAFAKTETLGSILLGLEKPVQFIHQIKTIQEIVNCASMSAFEKINEENKKK